MRTNAPIESDKKPGDWGQRMLPRQLMPRGVPESSGVSRLDSTCKVMDSGERSRKTDRNDGGIRLGKTIVGDIEAWV